MTQDSIFPGKLKPRWIGPFIIHQVYVNGVVELLNSNGKDTFRVNGYRLKPFMEPFKPEKKEINLLEPQKAWANKGLMDLVLPQSKNFVNFVNFKVFFPYFSF